MACFEQPEMKAAYTFVVHAPAGWQVLSNQSAVSAVENGDAQTVEFAPTLPLSSYITAVAAGPYHRVDAEWTRADQTIALGVLCRQSLAPFLEADEIIEVTKQGLEFFTDAFAFPYPWGKYDQIFVPEYNLGAMENPGLVTFTEAYLSRGAATDAQRGARANTILHEMAHMWFGDLVTMRWWDDLWLKESFADYMGAHVSVAATRFTDAWERFAANRKAWAYQQDQLPTTHPIVADITDLEAAKLNFDGITYAKGAAVLKQLVAFVGEEHFFEGARRYFAAHAYGNTTLEDLLVQLEEVSGRDVRGWSRAWLETSGVSTLWLESADSASDERMLVQSDPRPHRLRVGLYDLTGGALSRREQTELDITAERTPVELAEADLVLINDDDLTYAKARLDARSLEAVERALSTLEPLPRALVWSSLWNATRDGELSAARYLAIVGAHAPAEKNMGLAHRCARQRGIRDRALFDGRCASRTARRLARDDLDGSGCRRTRQRCSAVVGACVRRGIRVWMPRAPRMHGRSSTATRRRACEVDPDLRWSLLTALATTGQASDADIEAELARDATANGRTAAIRARAAAPTQEARVDAWHRAWEDESLTNDHLSATIDGVRAGGRRDLIAALDDGYFERIGEAWQNRSIEIARRLVLGLFPASSDLGLVDGWLAANESVPAALRRLVIEQRDHLARDLRVRQAQTQLES